MPVNQINVIKREDWGARNPKEEIPAFNFPGKHVVLTLKTDFGECHTKEECIQKCQSIQNQHMDQWGLPDIAYNFMIGNDGNVYEGRGWDFRPQRAINNPDHSPQTYNLALIGDYRADFPNSIHYQIFSWQDYGEQFKRLDNAYDVYASVDTKETFDPEVIKKEHEDFCEKYPSFAKSYGKIPDIRFDPFEMMKQLKGKTVKPNFPYMPIV